jgi:hypothetical protein
MWFIEHIAGEEAWVLYGEGTGSILRSKRF